MPESKIVECVKSVCPNAIVNIVEDQYGLKIEVFDNFTDSSEERLHKIFKSFAPLEIELKAKIGLVETNSMTEYAAMQQNDAREHQSDTQIPCEGIRWVNTPNIMGFIACGVKDEPELRRCESSFVLASLDKRTNKVHANSENFICENDAYSFIIRNGDRAHDYALNHVYNLAPSFFISPYMELYMRECEKHNVIGNANPYQFAFLPLPFTFVRPADNEILVLKTPELIQRIASSSVPVLKDWLASFFH